MATDRPKILYLVHRVPYPPNRGDRIRSYHLLEFLASRARVDLAFLTEEPPAAETMQVLRSMCANVFAVTLGRRTRWLHALRSLAGGRTATEGLFSSRELSRIVRNQTQAVRFDAALVFCSSMVQYLHTPGLAGVRTIVDLVDVDSQKWLDYARHSRGLKRWLFQLEGQRLRKLEASLPDRADAVTLVSSQEAGLYRSFCPTAPVCVIANGVDLDFFRPDNLSRTPSAETCVFVGALDYHANVDGVTWFCNEVWPQVLRGRPQAEFRVVGSNPSRSARRLAHLPRVDLVGGVPDVRPYVNEAAIAVVPLRVARGLQNKVLEAMAMGKAVVATPQASEGIDATPGVHLCRAATADDWVQTIRRLFSDRDLRCRLGRAAREFVQRRFQWETQLEPLGELTGLHKDLRQADTAPRRRAAV